MSLIPLTLLLLGVQTSTGGTIETNSLSPLQLTDAQLAQKFGGTAFKFFDFQRCLESNLGSEDECFKLSQIKRHESAVYIGRQREPIFSGRIYKESKKKKVFAVLPDSSSTKASRPHDLILAIDPYPTANFGHPLGLFYVDFNAESKNCKENHQLFNSDGTCISVGRKPRCPNLLERFTGGIQPRRCHIDFLPSVHLATSNHSPISTQDETHSNLLECVSANGFAPCPQMRKLEDTTKVLCDPSHSNTKRCDTSYTVGTRCKLFQSCDEAILIGGGWNRLHSGLVSLNNIFKMEEMLKKIGVLGENIKMFYANGPNSGNKGFPREHLSTPHLFSSAMKTGIRGHLRTICETRHCADSLFIYLNNPTTIDGDFLLWDVNENGIADDSEVYTTKEFLNDIARCEAKRIVLVIDQSNSEILVTNIKQSSEHQNIITFTPGLPNQVTVNGEITDIWKNHSHSVSCLKHIQQASSLRMKNSNPTMFDSTFGNLMKLSVIGAPCDLNPPLTNRELRSLYQGCQNIPTSIWFSVNFGDMDSEDGDEESSSNENSPNGRRSQ